MNTELSTQTVKPFDLSPQTFEQALTFSNYLAESDLVPKDFRGKPGNCLVAIQWGMEIGLKPLQAMQNIAVINGRPSLWGDAVIALARSSPVCEYVIESQTDDLAICKVKRRGEPEQERTFSKADAKAAGLLGKAGPWTQYPKRMMQMRARAFAMRDVFPDVLKGLPVAEELMDAPAAKNMGAAVVVQPATASEALIDLANTAANAGMAAYQEFWKASGPDNRKLLAGEHARLKTTAIDADKARTVQAQPESKPDADGVVSAPFKPFEDVIAMLCAAKDEEALYAAAEWIDQVPEKDQRDMLDDKFEECLADLRGAA